MGNEVINPCSTVDKRLLPCSRQPTENEHGEIVF